jgi:hypothetical protein
MPNTQSDGIASFFRGLTEAVIEQANRGVPRDRVDVRLLEPHARCSYHGSKPELHDTKFWVVDSSDDRLVVITDINGHMIRRNWHSISFRAA